MLLKNIVVAAAALSVLAACATPTLSGTAHTMAATDAEEAQILKILDDQEAAWNRGDIDGYMQYYWQSPDLRFASGGTVVRGWQPTKDRYLARYANRALMGTLSTTGHDINLLGSGTDAIAHGAWALARDGDAPSGLYTLIMRKIDGEWKIVSDTTTSAD